MTVKGALGNIMRQAQQMQEKMQRAQEKLAQTEFTGEAGSGTVKVIMSGDHNVKRVSIDAELLKDDKSLLEDLLAIAFNAAAKQIHEVNQAQSQNMMSGMNLPAGMKLPF